MCALGIQVTDLKAHAVFQLQKNRTRKLLYQNRKLQLNKVEQRKFEILLACQLLNILNGFIP